MVTTRSRAAAIAATTPFNNEYDQPTSSDEGSGDQEGDSKEEEGEDDEEDEQAIFEATLEFEATLINEAYDAYNDQPAFSSYLLILEEADDTPLVYIGTGTDKTKGTHQRFADYDNRKKLSQFTEIAYQEGYRITHKKILVSAPVPSDSLLVLSARSLFLVLETALTYKLYAYQDRKTIHPAFTNGKWGDSVPYGGLCSHEAWNEGTRRPEWFYSGLSPGDVEKIRRQRRKAQQGKRLENESPEDREARLAKVRKWQRERRENESPEDREARLAKGRKYKKERATKKAKKQRAK
ncbi:hypothetical protein B0H65DRAFT_552807 [Neurospora tetraspora]|uniref:Uncharacterized protein n=1 Tax=Neurospora tetraspora TaxID=94610 RepID=A0AAE0J7K9_9PEZI|nr:hypothetical protein B0H65DRAFT_552807 [Neurospora tetraspora]